ncbi:MAG: hypothetical protein COA71_01680 [SAR86 cluster bacterium]|uniref:Uncharacterized protein n=1 Tax=SAR86 cluster bacterium TaxID=2030880 RepID=A0A2A5CI96_9GAMM|nr:MAG: hypothetical protein COA71_01680 [SAR86 cluster bacterium]
MIGSTHNLKQLFGRFRISALLILCSTLISCSSLSTITIEGSYPSPLISPLPLTLGIIYNDTFSTYSFTELDEYSGEDQYIINSGSSQVALFNTILPAVFSEVIYLNSADEAADYPDLDMVFEPTIEEFQIGLPQKTRLDVYEIWVKYNMRLSAPDGNSIADWVMTAYGKSPQSNFGSVDAGVNEAAVEAFRDLAATFSLGFTSIPEVNAWLQINNVL